MLGGAGEIIRYLLSDISNEAVDTGLQLVYIQTGRLTAASHQPELAVECGPCLQPGLQGEGGGSGVDNCGVRPGLLQSRSRGFEPQ